MEKMLAGAGEQGRELMPLLERLTEEEKSGGAQSENLPTLEDLQPLYQAVAHGCLAGRHQEACVDVYRDRILRGTGPGGAYSTMKLGASARTSGRWPRFSRSPGRASPGTSPSPTRPGSSTSAAFSLRALGRLTEAREPMRVVL